MTRGLVQNKGWLLAWGAQLVRALLDVPPNLFGDHEISLTVFDFPGLGSV
jgi:hypothetical protein